MCKKEGLHQVDLLTPAERKITEKEYWAQRRGQEKLDKLNQKMKEDGITPKETRFVPPMNHTEEYQADIRYSSSCAVLLQTEDSIPHPAV